MGIGVINLLNPTEQDFKHNFAGEDVVIPKGKTVALPEDCATDCAYYLAQKILQAKGIPFFGDEHDKCIAELLGLTPEVTFFEVKSSKVKEVATPTGGTTKRLEVELDEDKLEKVAESKTIIPEKTAKKSDKVLVGDVAPNAVAGGSITLD